MTALLTLAGTAVLVLLLVDVAQTVFVPRGDGARGGTRGGAAAEQEPVTWLAGIAGRPAQVAQAQEQYALLAYFHVPDDARALPVAVARLLELLTVARSLVDPGRAPQLTDGPTVCFASRTAVAHVRGRAAAVGGAPPSAERTDAVRSASCARALERLRAAEVPLRSDGRAEQQYAALRSEWDTASAALLRHFSYDERSQTGAEGPGRSTRSPQPGRSAVRRLVRAGVAVGVVGVLHVCVDVDVGRVDVGSVDVRGVHVRGVHVDVGRRHLDVAGLHVDVTLVAGAAGEGEGQGDQGGGQSGTGAVHEVLLGVAERSWYP